MLLQSGCSKADAGGMESSPYTVKARRSCQGDDVPAGRAADRRDGDAFVERDQAGDCGRNAGATQPVSRISVLRQPFAAQPGQTSSSRGK